MYLGMMFLGLIGCSRRPEPALTIPSMEGSTESEQFVSSSDGLESIEPTKSTSEASSEKVSEDAITLYLAQFKDKPLSIYIKEIEGETSYGVNETVIMYGASVAKLPIILYTQEQLKSGVIKGDTYYDYTDEVNKISGAMIRGGTGIMQGMLETRQAFRVDELLAWSITQSDNLASNMLGYYVAQGNGEAFLQAMEPYYTFEQLVFTKNMTAQTAGNLMLAIYHNRIGLDYFKETAWHQEKIGVLDKLTYHKIGTNEAFNHDVGIVMGQKGYVLSILSEGYSNEELERIIKEIDGLLEGGKVL